MDSEDKKIIFGVVGIALIGFLVIFFLILNPFVKVGAGERGVMLNWGAFNGQVLEPGLNMRTPIAQSVVKMDVRTQNLNVEGSEAYSHDLQVVKIHSVLNYNLDPKSVGEVYKLYNKDYEEKIIRPNLEASVKQTIAKYSAEELLSKRGDIQAEIESLIRTTLPPQFTITKYSLVNEEFSDAYEQAIEKKQVAQQDAERAENELKKAKVEAEQRVVQAKAEAEAIKVQSEAANNDKYTALKALEVQKAAIEKWNGVLPSQMIPGQSIPFINVK